MLAALFAWIALAVIVGVVASKRGRVGCGWFLVTLMISALITGPLVLALPRQHAAVATGAASTSVPSVFKWGGITILFGCLVFVGMMLLAFVLIVQHGGA
jgi:hypothetical protein